MPHRWSETDARRFLRESPAPRAPRIPKDVGVPCTEAVFLVLPYPPLNNRYYRHVGQRVLLSAEGRAYQRVVAQIILVEWPRSVPKPFNNALTLTLDLYPPSNRHHPDIDAPLKAPLDALERAGVYLNDNLVCRTITTKHPARPPGGCLEVLIEPYKET